MKLARLVCAALALSFVSGWATSSPACENHKSTKASAAATGAKGAVCSPAMAANCTPEMMAACKASMAAGGADLCAGKNVSAVAASAGDHCGMAKASAVSASAHGSCGSRSATATAVTAANTRSASKTVYLAGANGSCDSKGAKASAAGAGQCGMASMAAMSGHADCDACVDMADCSGQLDAAGAQRQTVRLKNGIMYVYTAASPRTVSAVQAAVARRAERMTRFASAGDKTRLCPECKGMRGAMASGKLNREIVNIEGGSLTLVTSNDPVVVAKIHAMADDKVAVRVKS